MMVEGRGSVAAKRWISPGHFSAHDERTFHDISPDGIIVAEIDSERIVHANAAACSITGYSHDELVGRSLREMHPQDEIEQLQALFRSMSRREVKRKESLPVLRKDGSLLIVDLAATHILFNGKACLAGFFRDVTAQKQSFARLQASEQRYRLIAENVVDVIWAVKFPAWKARPGEGQAPSETLLDTIIKQWRFSYVSPAVERVFGYSPKEAEDLRIGDFVPGQSIAKLKEALGKSLFQDLEAAPVSGDIVEMELLAKDGATRWCEIVSTYLRDAEGNPTTLLGITRDVSARRRAERALHDSEERLRQLFDNLPDFVVKIDRQGAIWFANRGLPDEERERLLGRSWHDLVTPRHQAGCREAVERTFTSRQTQTLTFQDIFGRWWSSRLVPLTDEDRQQLLVISADITQERSANQAVRKERQLLRHLLELHERERQLVAYELHDGFAQQLTGALFRLQAFREMYGRDPKEAWHSFDSAAVLLRQAIDEARRLISGLRPPILDELGIVEAIQYLIYEQRKNAGPEVEFEHNLGDQRLAPALENTIFRVVQELLRNAFQHSGSALIYVSLVKRNQAIGLEVRDWGTGFEPSLTSDQHVGLRGVRERIRLLGGHVVIESAQGQGTRVAIDIPSDSLEEASEASDDDHV